MILHISGEKHLGQTSKSYEERLNTDQQKRVKVISFTKDWPYLISAATEVVSRAGATTLAELASAGKPCVVVPSPYVAGGHQLKNAEILSSAGACRLLANDAPVDEWFKAIDGLISSSKFRNQLSQKIKQFAYPGASKTLAEIILSVLNKKNGRAKI